MSTEEQEAQQSDADKGRVKESGDNSGEDTPVPISNTEVKLSSADDTWREAAWESRTLPVLLKKKLHKSVVSFFSVAYNGKKANVAFWLEEHNKRSTAKGENTYI